MIQTNRKGRKASIQNAQQLSIYVSDETMSKLNYMSQKTLVNKSAIARNILAKQLEAMEVTNVFTL
jgi:predicted DNA-binding protein